MGQLAIKSASQLPFFFFFLQPGIDFSLCIYNWRVQGVGGAALPTVDLAAPFPGEPWSRAGCDPVSSTSHLRRLVKGDGRRWSPTMGSQHPKPPRSHSTPLPLLPAMPATLPDPAASMGDRQGGIPVAGAGNMHFRGISHGAATTCRDGDTKHSAQPLRASPQCRERGTALRKRDRPLP